MHIELQGHSFLPFLLCSCVLVVKFLRQINFYFSLILQKKDETYRTSIYRPFVRNA